MVEAQNQRKMKKVRRDVFNHYGWECVCCGENNPSFLTLDHINNDGKAHRAITRNVYSDLRKRGYPPVVQSMCWNCNMAKQIYGTCPHQRCL